MADEHDTDTDLSAEELDLIVGPIVSKYRRRSWWMDTEEAMQEGRLAALRALRTFDPAVGIDVGAYLTRAVVFTLKRHLWTSQTQLSGGKHRPEEQLKGISARCVSKDAETPDGDPVVVLSYDGSGADVALHRARRLHEARSIIEEVAREARVSTGGVMVALGESAEEVSARTGTPAAALRREAARLRRGVAGSHAAMRFSLG